jgi:nucleobase:cation symporter-1, NCS1 family
LRSPAVSDPYELAADAAAVLAEATAGRRHDAVVVLGSGWGGAADAFGMPVAEQPVADLVWIASSFIGPFQGFLITLGVPIAAWCGVFLADLAMRRTPYAEVDLYQPEGRYGRVNPVAVGLVVAATAVGWGLVTNALASWLSWQGYLLSVVGLGGKSGAWAYANLGVAASFVIGFVGYLALGRQRVRNQERLG